MNNWNRFQNPIRICQNTWKSRVGRRVCNTLIARKVVSSTITRHLTIPSKTNTPNNSCIRTIPASPVSLALKTNLSSSCNNLCRRIVQQAELSEWLHWKASAEDMRIPRMSGRCLQPISNCRQTKTSARQPWNTSASVWTRPSRRVHSREKTNWTPRHKQLETYWINREIRKGKLWITRFYNNNTQINSRRCLLGTK